MSVLSSQVLMFASSIPVGYVQCLSILRLVEVELEWPILPKRCVEFPDWMHKNRLKIHTP